MLNKLISTALGAGYSPVAPGTAGSLVAVALYWFIPWPNVTLFLATIVVLFVVGILSSTMTEKESVSELGEKGHDPQIVVIDEVVGMLIACISMRKTVWFVVAGFVLFRLFDITKPFPINKSQNLPGGWGIMMDDVIAGLYAFLLIELFYLLA